MPESSPFKTKGLASGAGTNLYGGGSLHLVHL